VSEQVKAGLKKAQELRWEWARAQREVAERQRQLQAVAEGQGWLRANLRRRYLEELGQQEGEVEKYRAEV
jgi:hypothetical protein